MMRRAINKYRYGFAILAFLSGTRITSATFVGTREDLAPGSRVHLTSSSTWLVETVAHDGSTDRWGFNAAGVVTGATDRIGFSAGSYDAMNRLTSWQDHNGLVLSNSYDAAGNLTLVRYPDGKTVRYEYDLLNRCTNIVDWANRATRLIYDAGGRLTQASYPNGVQSFYLYDKEGRLTNYWHKIGEVLLTAAPFGAGFTEYAAATAWILPRLEAGAARTPLPFPRETYVLHQAREQEMEKL